MPATTERVGAVRLRPFLESDEREVSSWFADAGELRFFAGRRFRWPLDNEQWRGIHQDETIEAWTAVLGNDPTPVGHAELVTESPGTVRLARYAVAPTLRGHGLGRAILMQVLDTAQRGGFETIRLNVHPDNSTAILAYRTFGFVLVPEVDDEMSDRLMMSLDLGQL